MMQVVYNDVLFYIHDKTEASRSHSPNSSLQNTTLWAIESSFWKFGKWNVEIKILEKTTANFR